MTREFAVGTTPDLEGVRRYALDRLTNELSPALTYHCVAHTAADVVPNALRIGAAEGVSGRDLAVLEAAAWFHDLGFVVRADGHEQIGIGFAAEVLPSLGFADADLDALADAVLATRVPQAPTTRLGAILADADLDVLGRDDFFERNAALRDELAATGRTFEDAKWFGDQAAFLASHVYFTDTARRSRDAAKAAHLAVFRNLSRASASP